MPYAMISYADNHEDVVLRRAFPDGTTGFYIDVGAFDPVRLSVTKHFSDRGWRGINIEPVPDLWANLRDGRPRDVNLNVGVSDRAGTLTLYGAPGVPTWTSDRRQLTGWFGADPASIVERVVPVTTLAEVCARHAPGTIDFLKVDVDGHERAVLAGHDWARWRPRVVLVEANEPETWEPRLMGRGYLFALFDGVNRFYVREEDRGLLPAFRLPANRSDNFGVYGYLAEIDRLTALLGAAEGLGPAALGVARRLRDLAARFPRAAALVRRALRRAG